MLLRVCFIIQNRRNTYSTRYIEKERAPSVTGNWNQIGNQCIPQDYEIPLKDIAGEPVTLLSTVPMQYLEKAADGSLQVRQIPADSPDAPRYQLTFTVGAGGDAAGGLPLTCEIVLAMVKGREPVPGVNLKVEKWHTFDLQASFTGIRNLRLTGGVRNLTNEEPPFYNSESSGGYDTFTHSIIGRFYYARATFTFR